jgi:hypothetical protein
LAADSFYFVENGGIAEAYVTSAAGVAKSVGNSAMIAAIVDGRVTTALADFNVVEIVADIPARAALSTTRNQMALVLNATGDPTVASGAALYAYRESNATWIKITEYESMDVALTWASISGKPVSAVSLIDDAVGKRHAHANGAFLDKIGEAAGKMTYNGQTIGGADWATDSW